ncbi:MAG: PaaI family thioesterase [Candidatus Dadabacteria bacterium]|nr:PaaI family thioesterase [Candidatus Dadabacteria bacterium]
MNNKSYDLKMEKLKTDSNKSFYYKRLGMELCDLPKKGKASVAVKIKKRRHFHLYGKMHGGVTLSLADAAGGAALASVLDQEQKVATIALSLHFTAPANEGKVIANAKVIDCKQHFGTVEVSVVNETDDDERRKRGKVIAHGIAMYAILSPINFQRKD